jgi:Tol biopolymer transport system component
MSRSLGVRILVVALVCLWAAAPARAAEPIKLNGPLVANGDVITQQFSPDSSRVLYLADQDADNVQEIYSVPSTGGAAVKLNGPLVAGGDVAFSGLAFSPDSSLVLYHADQDADGVGEIYSVPSAGGTAVKLNGPLVAGGDVSFSGPAFRFSPDSSRVLYVADQDTDTVQEIYSVPSTGGAAVKLNGPLVAGGNVSTNGLAFSPDSSRVLYVADQDTDTVQEIYSVPSAGGAAVKLNGPLVAGGGVFFLGQQFSPDGSRVLYFADQDTDTVNEIYSVPSTGGTPVKLNGPLVAGGNVSTSGLAFSPDSSRVLYLADQDTDFVDEIYSVPSAGGAAVKLNGPLVAGGDVSGTGLQFSPDGSLVLYLADQDTDFVNEIYSVPSAGGAATKLNGPLVAGGDVLFQQFSPDSSRVFYGADQETDNVNEIYSVPSAGGTAVKLNGPLVANGDISGNGLGNGLQFSPDGSLVLYYADQDTDEVFEIYARIVRQHSNSGGGDWDAGGTWNHGGEPDEVMQVFVDTPATVTASGGGTRSVNELAVGGGAGTSTLNLEASAVIAALNGVSIRAGGIVRGDGRIEGQVNELGGELRVAQGDTLTLSSVTTANEGRFFLQGGTLQIDSPLTNAATGQILGRGALFTGGLMNNGHVAFSSGVSDVFGDVENDTGDTAIGVSVSGNADVTFWDDVNNVAGSLFRVSAGSSATFFGTFGGAGISGTGDVFLESDVTPGASPAVAEFGGNVSLGANADLVIELGGLAIGSEHDALDVTGLLSLDGTLEVSLISGFSPTLGDSFDILDWGTLDGEFSELHLPTLAGLSWNTSQLYTTGVLSLAAASLPGDYSQNGTVDAADYTVWRDRLGQLASLPNDDTVGVGPDDYDRWVDNFGQTSVSGSGAVSDLAPGESPGANYAVPEPASLLAIAMGGMLLGLLRWRTPGECRDSA